VRGLATAAGAVLLALFVVIPVSAALWLTGKPREPLAVSLGIPHSDVTLRAADGVRLAGWYVPSRNGSAIVLVHGGGGDRGGVVRHARLLAREGYGVLLYDERGRGESGGRTNGMGWNWHHDVRAAVDWLEARGVNRVGALGLSTGAEAVVTAAAHDPRIDAVVAEGVINRSSADTRHLHDWSGSAYWWVAFKAIAVQTHDSPPEPLTEDFRRVAPRPLLLITAAENPPERTVAPAYRRAAGPTASFWLARTGHTHALSAFPAEYRRRVVGFLNRALAAPEGTGNHTPETHGGATGGAPSR
jgi:predicted acyl esterase